MEEIAVSRFKATCLAVLENVRRTKKPIRITRFGKAIAEVTPVAAPPASAGWLGSMAATGRICGDVVNPATDEADWDMLR